MRAKPVNADEQYRLIMECGSSGPTDYQWCLEHNIKPGTFYNWVKRLRKKECDVIPSSVGGRVSSKQGIVKIDFQKPFALVPEPKSIPVSFPYPASALSEIPVIELLMSGTTIRIPQGIDAAFLEQVLRTLGRTLC